MGNYEAKPTTADNFKNPATEKKSTQDNTGNTLIKEPS